MAITQKSISDIQSGKYVELDVPSAYEAICKTQSLGADWSVFLQNAPEAVLRTKFDPCVSLVELREFVCRDFEKGAEENDDAPLPDRLRRIHDSAGICLQRYDIEVPGTKGKVMIWRTPTAKDFDKARAVILFVLELFRQADQDDLYKKVKNSNPQLSMTIRGMEKFFDIDIGSGINKEAWVGFDFR